jgi:hypothetical protein
LKKDVTTEQQKFPEQLILSINHNDSMMNHSGKQKHLKSMKSLPSVQTNQNISPISKYLRRYETHNELPLDLEIKGYHGDLARLEFFNHYKKLKHEKNIYSGGERLTGSLHSELFKDAFHVSTNSREMSKNQSFNFSALNSPASTTHFFQNKNDLLKSSNFPIINPKLIKDIDLFNDLDEKLVQQTTNKYYSAQNVLNAKDFIKLSERIVDSHATATYCPYGEYETEIEKIVYDEKIECSPRTNYLAGMLLNLNVCL